MLLITVFESFSFEMADGYREQSDVSCEGIPYESFWKTLSKDDRSRYDQKLTLDGTGAYHWREPCALGDVTMVSNLGTMASV